MGVLKNIKHEKFAQGIATGLSARQAYVQAGYKEHDANANRLRSNEKVSARIAELTAPAVEATGIEAFRITKEMARVGLSDIRKTVDEHGNALNLHDLDDDTAAAISAVEVIKRPLKGQQDEKGQQLFEITHRVKFWDKNSALNNLAKSFALYAQDQAAQQTADSISEFLEAIKGAQPTPVATRETDD